MLEVKVSSVNLSLFTFLLLNVAVDNSLGVTVDLITVYETSEGIKIENGKISITPEIDAKVVLHGTDVNLTSISFAHKPPSANEFCDDFRKTDTFKTDNKGLVTLNFKVINISYFLR